MNEALAVLAFHQVYDTVSGNIALSALIAGVPLYILFIMLAVLRLPAWISALVAMLSAAVLAALVWGCRLASMPRPPPRAWQMACGQSAGLCSTPSSSTT